MQAGFLAMLDAVEKFDPERDGGGFLAVLRLTLKTRFAEESGIRTTRRDALTNCTVKKEGARDAHRDCADKREVCNTTHR